MANFFIESYLLVTGDAEKGVLESRVDVNAAGQSGGLFQCLVRSGWLIVWHIVQH